MKILHLNSSSSRSFSFPPLITTNPHILIANTNQETSKQKGTAKSGGFSLDSITNSCKSCKGQGAIECPGEQGRTRRTVTSSNVGSALIDCQGFGLKSCPACGKGGLTPEQRGER